MTDLQALEYPRHVHRPSVPGAWVYLIVQNAEECAAALADGWSLDLILVSPEPVAPPDEASDPPGPPDVEPPRRPGWPKGKPRKVKA